MPLVIRFKLTEAKFLENSMGLVLLNRERWLRAVVEGSEYQAHRRLAYGAWHCCLTLQFRMWWAWLATRFTSSPGLYVDL